MILLKGMTWNHDRGLAPMIATAERFRESHPEVGIDWEARSLRDFGDAPVGALADEYDLVVLDHPFMGTLAKAGCFLPLDEHFPPEVLAGFAEDGLGVSHATYTMGGHQWALANDAAAQVMCYRADLLEREAAALPCTWEDVLHLAHRRRGFVSVALSPLDALICFFTLCANAGDLPFTTFERVVSREAGEYALEMLRKLADCSAPVSFSENPIALYERMSSTDETAYCPLAFGYSNYSRLGYRARLLSFGAIPSAGHGPVGATLGGAGLAISVKCKDRASARAYAAWVAGRDCQRTLYVESGGQPGSRSAWEDEAANALTNGYFRMTKPVLEQAWVRPRFHGFVEYQNAAAPVAAHFLTGDLTSRQTLDEFDRLLRHFQKQQP